MITDINGFQSENGIHQLSDGTYRLVETTYSGLGNASTAILKELVLLATSELVACDLLVVLSDGSILFRDFMKIASGDWRDSYGRCAEELGELMPPELGDFRKVGVKAVMIEVMNNAISPGKRTSADNAS